MSHARDAWVAESLDRMRRGQAIEIRGSRLAYSMLLVAALAILSLGVVCVYGAFVARNVFFALLAIPIAIPGGILAFIAVGQIRHPEILNIGACGFESRHRIRPNVDSDTVAFYWSDFTDFRRVSVGGRQGPRVFGYLVPNPVGADARRLVTEFTALRQKVPRLRVPMRFLFSAAYTVRQKWLLALLQAALAEFGPRQRATRPPDVDTSQYSPYGGYR